MTGDAVALWLDAYAPEYAPARYGPLIQDAVRRLEPDTVKAARFAAGVLSGLVMWADEAGLDVTVDALLDREVIDRYVSREMGPLGYAPASRVSAHWQLRSLAAVSGRALPGAGPGGVYRADRPGASPYGPADVDGFLGWAHAMRSPVNRHALLAVLTATLGAGLTRNDLAGLPGTAVTRDARGGCTRVAVRAGARPRTVTVLDRYAFPLLDLARRAGPRWLVRPDLTGTEDLVTVAVNSMRRDARLPMLTASRCRATWVCGHLTAGTRLDVLVDAGGFAGADGLAPFLAAASRVPPARAAGLLREPRRGQPTPLVPPLRPRDRP